MFNMYQYIAVWVTKFLQQMILSENSPPRKNSFDDNCMLNMDQYIAVGLTSILQQMILIDDEQQDYELRKEVVIPECIKTLFYTVI